MPFMVINTKKDTTTTSIEAVGAAHRAQERRSIFITNTSTTAGVKVTIAVGKTPAVENEGIVIWPGSAWFEADSEGFECTQEAIQVVSSANGSIAISESYRSPKKKGCGKWHGC